MWMSEPQSNKKLMKSPVSHLNCWIVQPKMYFSNDFLSVFRSMEASSAQRSGCLSRNRTKNR